MTLGDFRNKAGTSAKLSTHHRRAVILVADTIVTPAEAYLERELDKEGPVAGVVGNWLA